MPSLSLELFHARVAGRVVVTVERNDDPRRWGCDVLDRALPPETATAFPVCRAAIEHPAEGYAAAMGWVQLVLSSDSTTPDTFDVDPLALYRDVDTPFAFFGIKPLFFDAPFRPTKSDLRWEAVTYLAAVEGGVMTKKVRPLLGFTWGFDVASGTVELRPASALPVESWDTHVPLLAARFRAWRFLPVSSEG